MLFGCRRKKFYSACLFFVAFGSLKKNIKICFEDLSVVVVSPMKGKFLTLD